MKPASLRLATIPIALALSLIATGGASALAQSPDPVAADLSQALLRAEDLPTDVLSVADMTYEPAFDFDEASFEASGGLEAVAQTWQAPEVDPGAAVLILFDFRFLFPDEEAAQAYLDAAEPILSETSTGITLQGDTPTIGDDLRHYAGQLSQGGVTVDVHNFLVRRGPLVAKVYLGGFGTTLEDALPIAQAAAARMDAWLVMAPVMSAMPGGSPDAEAAASPVAEPAASPDTVPGGSPEVASSASPGMPSAESGSQLRQWAAEATASSEYGSDSWSASQATGSPDVDFYADDPRSWAPANREDSIEWLELRYDEAVVPTGITVIESLGSGALTAIEAFDAQTGEWVELWSGTSEAIEDIASFSPDLEPVDFPADRLRLTLDTGLVVGWNEIDAVELVGIVP